MPVPARCGRALPQRTAAMMMWGLVLLLLLAFFIDPIDYNSAAVMELARIGCYMASPSSRWSGYRSLA